MTPLEEARRLVIKIGSSILVDETRGEVRRDWLESLTDSVARLHKGGCEIVLVSSGAIRLGRTQFKLPPGPSSSRKARPPPPPARSGSPMPTRRRWRGTASPWRRCC